MLRPDGAAGSTGSPACRPGIADGRHAGRWLPMVHYDPMAIRAYSAPEHVRLCTVALLAGRTFLGSGFFVADGTVVTCAHVLRRVRMDVTVVWSDRSLSGQVLVRDPAQPGDTDFYPFPDVAFVRLVDRLDHPVVFLDEADLEAGSLLYVAGQSRYTPEPDAAADTAELRVLGLGGRYAKVASQSIVGGMSGGPAFDPATGHVYGMLKAGGTEGNETGFLIKSYVIRERMVRHGRILRAAQPDRPPLRLPEPATPLYRMLRAQREVAKRYPYRLARLSSRPTPPLTTVYVEQRTQARRSAPTGWAAPLAPDEPDVISPVEMIHRHRNALVVGDPGGGKSKLLLQPVDECAAWWLGPAPARSHAPGSDADVSPLGPVVAVKSAATDLLGPRPWFESVSAAVTADLGGYGDLALAPQMFADPPVPGAEWLILVDGLDEVLDPGQRDDLVPGSWHYAEFAYRVWRRGDCLPCHRPVLIRNKITYCFRPAIRAQCSELPSQGDGKRTWIKLALDDG